MGGAGNLPAPSRLPADRNGREVKERPLSLLNEGRLTRCAGQVAWRNRLAACATPRRAFARVSRTRSILSHPLLITPQIGSLANIRLVCESCMANLSHLKILDLFRGLPSRRAFLAFLPLILCAGCGTFPPSGTPASRSGDEMVAAGRFFHTGTRVVLWTDPGGYDAYRVERRFAPITAADWEGSKAAVKALTTPNRYGIRTNTLSPQEIERVRGGGWDLPLLQRVVDQFVIHYDAIGTSRQCFKALQDDEGLSTHFLLDVDGTLYQTLDLKERARHATTSNDRSVGIEIANIGAYPAEGMTPLAEWASD